MNSNLFHTNSGLILAFAFCMPGLLVLPGSWACSVCVCVWVCVCVCVCAPACAHTHTQLLSGVQLFATPRTTACQAPLFLGFFRQEYWCGLPFPTQGVFPTQASNLCVSYLGRQIPYRQHHLETCLGPYRALMHFLPLPELFAKGIFSDTITRSGSPITNSQRTFLPELFFFSTTHIFTKYSREGIIYVQGIILCLGTEHYANSKRD